ncbi:MAG: TlpA family protein disulfide reductase [Gammaproteobacteria bacterium]|nr:TlpA family protein disulfide reductase [Gammaproteobacteria bacterium]
MPHFLASLIILIFIQGGPVRAEPTATPDFLLPTRSGMVSPADLKGKVIYLDFWASWCSPCRKSFPWLNQIQAQYRDQGLVVLGINLDRDRQLADRFLQLIPANFIIAFDPEGRSADSFAIRGMPSSFLIDRNGYLHSKHTGFRERDKNGREQAIAQLLSEP